MVVVAEAIGPIYICTIKCGIQHSGQIMGGFNTVNAVLVEINIYQHDFNKFEMYKNV